MSFEIIWGHAALATFYALHPNVATVVDRAVIRFAATGEGELEWVPPYHRLRAGAHELALVIDPTAETIAVLRIYRARAPR